MSNLLRPRALTSGDAIRIVAPAGPFDRARFDRGVGVLEKKGFEVRFDDGLFDTERYLAGSDERRLAELQAAFEEDDTRAVWAARGGYGSMRLLDRLDFSPLIARPKAVLGFSDLTAVHGPLNAAGLVTFHAPVVCGLGEAPDEVLDATWRLLCGEQPGPLLFEPYTTVTGGIASGPLYGGNLSVLTRLIGTPYLPELAGAVLFLEDVGERPYRLDRMLTHLRLSGAVSKVAGVLVGELTGCEPAQGEWSAAEVVAECLRSWEVPVVMGFPAGHGERNYPLPLGLPVEMDADEGRLSWSQPAVEPA